jgi:hypothetical protein
MRSGGWRRAGGDSEIDDDGGSPSEREREKRERVKGERGTRNHASVQISTRRANPTGVA